jgi:hypothetical protein
MWFTYQSVCRDLSLYRKRKQCGRFSWYNKNFWKEKKTYRLDTFVWTTLWRWTRKCVHESVQKTIRLSQRPPPLLMSVCSPCSDVRASRLGLFQIIAFNIKNLCIRLWRNALTSDRLLTPLLADCGFMDSDDKLHSLHLFLKCFIPWHTIGVSCCRYVWWQKEEIYHKCQWTRL